jgi:hypothetical protein
MDATNPSPRTPPAQLRPYERLAQLASELPKGCLATIPVVSGLILWGRLGALLTMLCVVGSLWRVISLRGVRLAKAANGVCRAWFLVAVLGTLVGIGGCTGRAMAPPGPLEEWTGVATIGWRWLVLLEILLATAWVAHGAIERGSRWALVPLAIASVATLGSVLCQVALTGFDDATPVEPWVPVVLGGLGLAGGVVGPALLADGCGRLLNSLSSESLDEETAGSGP